jgi:hypothetical protein
VPGPFWLWSGMPVYCFAIKTKQLFDAIDKATAKKKR